MLTTKQRIYLRGLAHNIKACFQIGKEGLGDNLLRDVLNYLNKHEIMKISILNNSLVTFDEAAEFFTEAGIDVVQKIGHLLILYKHSDKIDNPIKLPR